MNEAVVEIQTFEDENYFGEIGTLQNVIITDKWIGEYSLNTLFNKIANNKENIYIFDFEMDNNQFSIIVSHEEFYSFEIGDHYLISGLCVKSPFCV